MTRPTPIVDEFRLIDAIRAMTAQPPVTGGIRLGIGDDAAVVDTGSATLVTTDSANEGVHFRRDWLSPVALGRRAFLAAVSDVAAMGGRPRYALLSLSLPRDYAAAEACWLARGFVRAAADVGTALIGGNIARARTLGITATIFGQPPRRLPARDRARVGDAVFVTGHPGMAAAGIAELRRGRRSGRLISAYRRPPLRVDVGAALAERGVAAAMIDVSDGLLADLGHIGKASDVSIRLDPDSLPVAPVLRRGGRDPLRFVLGGGDDYELAFTTRPRRIAEVESLCARHDCVVTRIGTVTKATPGRDAVQDASGGSLSAQVRGFRHFAEKS